MKSDLCESHGYFEEASKLRRATLSESLCNIFHHPRLIGFGASMELDRFFLLLLLLLLSTPFENWENMGGED